MKAPGALAAPPITSGHESVNTHESQKDIGGTANTIQYKNGNI